MKLTKNISFKYFKEIKKDKNLSNLLSKIKNENNQIIKSLSGNYKDSFSKKKVSKYKKYSNVRLIGMGGSSLGAQSIYDFLQHKVKKNFLFINNLATTKKISNNKKNSLNLIISKSGNTLETIANSNLFLSKNQKNIFITQNKKSYLRTLANELKSEVFAHNNFIGGRYSVLSEVGMLPATLMGLNPKKYRRFNKLIKNKRFVESLITNVSNIFSLYKQKKFNSVILNYDERSTNLFYWYQQLVAESLGKKSKGLLPVVSTMPKDNHSLMQFYLDGIKNNFFTFFFVEDKLNNKIQNKFLLKSHKYLKSKDLNHIKKSQFVATENIFKKNKIPFRSFYVNQRNEESLGELFTFFILETILLGKLMNINPYDQPAVELIKNETKKTLTKF